MGRDGSGALGIGGVLKIKVAADHLVRKIGAAVKVAPAGTVGVKLVIVAQVVVVYLYGAALRCGAVGFYIPGANNGNRALVIFFAAVNKRSDEEDEEQVLFHIVLLSYIFKDKLSLKQRGGPGKNDIVMVRDAPFGRKPKFVKPDR